MKLLNSIVALAFFVILTACTAEPQPIPYGQANCTHCNMTVTDNRYGAELVNDKGKPFYFDAVECLAAYAGEQPDLLDRASFVMVTDFVNPGNLVDAKNAHFLQSENLPSPMGMNLTAFSEELQAKQMEQEQGGRLLTWNQVLSVVKNDAKYKR